MQAAIVKQKHVKKNKKKPTAAATAKPSTATSNNNTKTKSNNKSPVKTGLKKDASSSQASLDSSDQSTVASQQSSTQNQVISLAGEDFQAMIARMQQSTALKLRQKELDQQQQAQNTVWTCPFDKATILKIWKTPKHLLKNDDERFTQRLLLKYNGTYTAYYSANSQRILALQNPANASDINATAAAVVPQYRRIQWEKYGKLVSQDVDERARQVLREIDRAATTRNEYIASDVLHGQDQRFPTQVLRVHLEEELDRILSDQILDRERAERYRVRLSDREKDALDERSAVGNNASSTALAVVAGDQQGASSDNTTTTTGKVIDIDQLMI